MLHRRGNEQPGGEDDEAKRGQAHMFGSLVEIIKTVLKDALKFESYKNLDTQNEKSRLVECDLQLSINLLGHRPTSFL
jgi:hypothetical protein